MNIRRLVVLGALLLAAACQQQKQEKAAALTPHVPSKGMSISSPAFKPGDLMPAKYGCSGQNVSPPLALAGVPAPAKTLALIVDDPDAPGHLFTHWVVWNIPPSTTSVAEGQPPAGGIEGQNSYGRKGWGTPCPPNGEHRYVFDLFALDTTMSLEPDKGREDLRQAMQGHIVAEAQMIGRYRR